MSSFQAEKWRRWISGEMIWHAAGRSGYDEASTSIRHSTQPRTASLPSAARFRGTGSLPPCRFDGGAVPATRAVAIDIMSNLHHRDRILQFDEAAARML